jgi:hypothetical protein
MSITNNSAAGQPAHPIVPSFSGPGLAPAVFGPLPEEPGEGPAPIPVSRFNGQAGTATNVTAVLSARRPALTSQQASLLTLTDAEIVQYYLMVGDIELAPTQTEPATRALRADIRVAFQSKTPFWRQVKTKDQIDALNNLVDGADRFRQAINASRETVRGWLQASRDTDSMFFLDQAVKQCTNSVRKELYTGKPYPPVLISPETVLQKVHSLRNREAFVRFPPA